MLPHRFGDRLDVPPGEMTGAGEVVEFFAEDAIAACGGELDREFGEGQKSDHGGGKKDALPGVGVGPLIAHC